MHENTKKKNYFTTKQSITSRQSIDNFPSTLVKSNRDFCGIDTSIRLHVRNGFGIRRYPVLLPLCPYFLTCFIRNWKMTSLIKYTSLLMHTNKRLPNLCVDRKNLPMLEHLLTKAYSTSYLCVDGREKSSSPSITVSQMGGCLKNHGRKRALYYRKNASEEIKKIAAIDGRRVVLIVVHTLRADKKKKNWRKSHTNQVWKIRKAVVQQINK